MNIKRVIFLFFLLHVIYLLMCDFKFSSINYNYIDIYNKYIPNYKEKYDYLLNNYELLKENYTFIPAEVTGMLNNKITGLFYINKGLKDNVINNSYVVNEQGLVGVIRKTFNNYSIAQVISSTNLNMAVEINDCYGTLKNDKISDLINCNNINIGDPIFTSKYSISSSNILVGYVSKINNNSIFIKYSINPYKVKFVGVVYDKH